MSQHQDRRVKGDMDCTKHLDKCVFVQISKMAGITDTLLFLMDSFTVISIKGLWTRREGYPSKRVGRQKIARVYKQNLTGNPTTWDYLMPALLH